MQWKRLWFPISLLLAAAQLQIIIAVKGNSYKFSIEAAQGVVKGLPHWQIFQSRVLGPYAVNALAGFTGSFSAAHHILLVAIGTLTNIVILQSITKAFSEKFAWQSLLIFNALFCSILDDNWLYIWDSIDIAVIFIFLNFIITEKDYKWFALLFAIAALNRESALFISLWMVIDPIVKARIGRTPINLKMLSAGIVCSAAGVWLIHTLRTNLLVREIGPELFGQHDLAMQSTQIHLLNNIAFIAHAISGFQPISIISLLIIISTIFLATAVACRDPRRYLALAITQMAMIGAIGVMALLSEPRVMLDLLPFIVVGQCLVRPQPAADALPRNAGDGRPMKIG